jgi:hypothetical protein
MQRWFAAKAKTLKFSVGCLIEGDEKEVMNNLRKNLPCCHHSMLRLMGGCNRCLR